MLIKTLPVGLLETNCYIVTDENTFECAVIDPGDESNTVMSYLEENRLVCRFIFITHGHYDHVMAAREVSAQTGAPIYINRRDTGDSVSAAQYRFKPDEATRFYAEGDVITVGGLSFRILETPGHSPGGVSLLCQNALFAGDTLFRGSCGRVDLPGGDMDTLLRSLKRLGDLPGDYEVYPGHEASSTLEYERRFNPYMKHAAENMR
jgi:glyoxylase-like metal-dependent hydrolase (beta-lactamase superfamily II)